MNLEEFIHESLVQIVRGVKLAHDEALESGVNPPCKLNVRNIKGKDGRPYPVEEVEFDVAVTATSESEKGGKAGITVVSMFGVGGEAKSTSALQSESRVKFRVTVAFPGLQ